MSLKEALKEVERINKIMKSITPKDYSEMDINVCQLMLLTETERAKLHDAKMIIQCFQKQDAKIARERNLKRRAEKYSKNLSKTQSP